MNSLSGTKNLRIANWPKARGGDSLPRSLLDEFAASGLLLDTCLRQLHIACEPVGGTGDRPKQQLPADADVRRGASAYCYALEVITGLRSEIPGETNVFGQFHKAWQTCRDTAPPAVVSTMAPWVHRLINDARVIRREHLHGIGGGSYGTLVRRLIAPQRGDRVLFVGAGGLARSVVPYFDACDVGIWNRRRFDLGEIRAKRCFDPDVPWAAAAWANHVVFTTPPDERHDTAWRSLLNDSDVRTVVHLGHRRADPGARPAGARAFGLDDLFALGRRQAALRNDRLARARNACGNAAHALADESRTTPIGELVITC